MSNEKKGITVKIDADLHAEIKEYIESQGMTMAQFIEKAVDNELHPKFNNNMEENNMEKMRTLAFQVPEDLFQKVKDYLQRNNISQKQFVIVRVNRSGTILVKEPFEFDGKDHIPLTGETSPNFLCEEVTPREFLNGDYEQAEAEEMDIKMGGI